MRRSAKAVAASLILLAGCSAAASPRAIPTPTVSPTPSPTPVAMPKLSVVVTHSPAPAPTHAARRASTQHRIVRPVVPKPPALLVTRLHGVGSARQVISVVASGYGTSNATLQAFEKSGSTWRRVFGPWSAHVGRNGFAPPGDKREGDLRSPSGSYGFSFMYGVRSNPGVRYDWRPVTGSYDVWDDDPSSARYNLWSDTRNDDAGRAPESMQQTPAYDYGAVIAYNTARKPGLGSAIFFHVSTGGGTAGCVSLPTSELLEVLRWMDPAKGARIVMGTESKVT